MSPRLAGVLALCVGLPGAGIQLSRFREGRATLPLSQGDRYEARRDSSPLLFWAYTAINAALAALIIVAGIALMVLA